MPLSAPLPADALPFAAYVCTDEGADVARDAVTRVGVGETALRGGGLSGAARLSTGAPIARILLAEIGNIPVSMACESVAEIRQTGAEVIVLGRQDDLATYRELRRAGALEYFAFPVAPEEIVAIQRKTAAANDPAPVTAFERPRTAPRIGVLGSNGGVGASLLARNLAWFAAASRGPGLRTALVDADLRFGSQAIELDRDETPGFFEALSAPDRIDATFLGATMDKPAERLSLFSHQGRGRQDIDRLEAGLPRLVAPLSDAFEALVLDLPRDALMRQGAIAASLDALIVVVPAGYAGVNAASRLLDAIRAEAPDLRLLPVLSDLRRDAGLSRKDIATGLGREVAAILPRCDADVTRAHRAARSILETRPRGAYSRATRALWQAATATPETDRTGPTARRKLLQRILR